MNYSCVLGGEELAKSKHHWYLRNSARASSRRVHCPLKTDVVWNSLTLSGSGGNATKPSMSNFRFRPVLADLRIPGFGLAYTRDSTHAQRERERERERDCDATRRAHALLRLTAAFHRLHEA